jgi:AbrB family looped-hinge helix DNA binding protein
MPSVQVHYDGWLALPEAVRRKLDVTTGDRLEVEVADGAVVLRPARPADAAGDVALDPAAGEQPVEAEPELASVAASAPTVKRGAGRRRKASAEIGPTSSPKARGRRKNIDPAELQPGTSPTWP